jgi:Arc/MetJ-type ribon-helix-helix transcriptional regulator
MINETRIHISIKIPEHLHDIILLRVAEGKYKDKTACVTVALENELSNTHQEEQYNTQTSYCSVTETKKLEIVLQEKHAEIERLMVELSKASDPVELAQLRTKSEELERHNETLKKELEISQETHRNYMMQMQTLITQKQIEIPGAKKPWWQFW